MQPLVEHLRDPPPLDVFDTFPKLRDLKGEVVFYSESVFRKCDLKQADKFYLFYQLFLIRLLTVVHLVSFLQYLFCDF